MRYRISFSVLAILVIFSLPVSGLGEDSPTSKPTTRTIVADILMIDGDFYVVRGDRGEIRIEVTPDTKLSEEFKFGDRIKAVVLPNDSAISIERAREGESLGVTPQEASPEPSVAASEKQEPTALKQSGKPSESEGSTSAPANEERGPTTRIVVADILMVDGEFYVVRTEFGEIRVEVTPDTRLEEEFEFGDRIKAHILPNDRAISVQRANPDEPIGIVTLEPAPQPAQAKPQAPPSEKKEADVPSSDPIAVAKGPKTRIIVAEILMVDGDFYVVRGDRGEIRIEVTPNTKLSEQFKFGDKIKARVLPTDEAISVERAQPTDLIGVTDAD